MKKTICYARLRSRVNFTEPLNDILDYLYDFMREFKSIHKDVYDFTLYNIGFNQKPTRDLDAIKKADLIVIPSEAEFQYHIPGYIHTLDHKASNEHVKDVFDAISGTNKELLILQSDRKDSPDLYRTRTFPGLLNKIHVIDDMDFKGTIQSVKYWYTKKYNEQRLMASYDKRYDFCYYGCDKSKDIGGVKSGDLRSDFLKLSKKDTELNSYYIGRFNGFKADLKFQRNFKIVIPYLCQSRATICFNWPGFNKAPTTRYAEAMACKMIPLVWHNYDENNMVVSDTWQRCKDFQDFKEKVIQLRDEAFFESKYKLILDDYLTNKILTKAEYFQQMTDKFYEVLNDKLKG